MNDYNEREHNERDNNDIETNDYGSFSGDVPLITGYNIRKLFIENFWKYLIVISAYYALPSLQFVFFQAHDANVHCYYNKKCKHNYDNIPAFNNVIL